MSEGSILYKSWFGLAATLILFSVSFARLNMGIYHIPIPVIFIVILMIGVALKGFSLSIDHAEWNGYRPLLFLTVLILITHGISMFRSYPIELSVKEFIKISSGILTFWFVIIFFPKDFKFINLFFKASAIGSIILLVILLYHYGIHLKAPYLATLYSKELSPEGKSHLAWVLAMLFPYYLNSVFEKRVSIFWVIANTIVGVSIIYAMSRASWIAVAFSMCFFGFFVVKDRLYPNIKMVILLAVVMSLALGLLINHVQLGKTLALRIQSIYSPTAMPETDQSAMLGKYSLQNRATLIERSWGKFKEDPLLGIGLSAAAYENGMYDSEVVTHNDYLCLLAETGLVGAIPFFIFLFCFAKRLFFPLNCGNNKTFLLRAAQASFLTMLIVSNFINTYTSIHYWFFLALALKIGQICREPTREYHANAA